MFNEVSLHYSHLTVFFYIALGILAMFCFYKSKKSEKSIEIKRSFPNRYLLIWWFVWVFFAVFRLVIPGIGGSDAHSYINFFQNCNSATMTSWYEHVGADLGFKWLTKICRYISSDYKFYFLIIYGFMAYAYIKFVNKFASKKTIFAPFLLTFFLYLRSYSSIRSNMAIALIALGCICIIKKDWKYAYLLGFLAVLFHKSAFIYAACIPFCHFFNKRTLSVKTALTLVTGSALIGRTLQALFLHYATTTDLKGSYAYYASTSIGVSFFDNAWKIAFEQLALALMMLLTHKKIGKDHSEQEQLRLKIIWMLCIFDFMIIPINFIIGSWRGYEYFYLARIVMWGECFYQTTKRMSIHTKQIYSFILIAIFIAWMAFRINATWLDTCLSPYIFEPLGLIL